MPLDPRKYVMCLIVFSFLILTMLPLHMVHADPTSKLAMVFRVEYDMPSRLAVVSTILEESGQSDGFEVGALPEAGAQVFGCAQGACQSPAYDYSDDRRLEIIFTSGAIRPGNGFTNKNFSACFQVAVREDDSLIREQRGSNISSESDPWLILLVAGAVLGVLCVVVVLAVTVYAVRAGDIKKNEVMSAVFWIVSIPMLICFFVVPPGFPVFMIILGMEISMAALYAHWRHWSISRLLPIVWMMNLIPLPVLGFLMEGQFLHTPISGYLSGVVGFPVVSLIDACILAAAMRKKMRFREALFFSFVLNAVGIGMEFLFFFIFRGVDFFTM